MTVGTKSLLFGVHQFILHPILIFVAWWRIYGFPWDPRLWVAFVVHDWGYWGCPNMDGDEGEMHPQVGARIMHALFDGWGELKWHDFMMYHSRFLAARRGVKPSRLCWADKLVITMYPKWLYKILSFATGEIHEYMAVQKHRHELGFSDGGQFDDWWEKVKKRMYQLCEQEAGYRQ